MSATHEKSIHVSSLSSVAPGASAMMDGRLLPCASSTRPSGAMSSRSRLPGALATVRTRPESVAANSA